MAVAGWATAAESDVGRTIVLDDHSLPRPRWVLVLSGGGARGLAQIGVLRVLERERLYPTAVVGTSIGAVIGALWCAGYSADDIDSLVRHIHWQELFRIGDERSRGDLFLDQKAEYDRTVLTVRMDNFRPVVPEAISTGQRLEMLLAELFWRAPYQCDGDFDRFRVPFRAVATDLVRGNTVVLRSGSIATAVRASSTFPLQYMPVRQDTFVLADGGLLANIPVEIARTEFRPDFVVAVNTTSPLLPQSALDKPWNIADQVVTLMMQRFNTAATSDAWLTITPDLGDHSTLDFSKFDSLVASGQRAAERAASQLRAELERRQQALILRVLGDRLGTAWASSALADASKEVRMHKLQHTAAVLQGIALYGAVVCRRNDSGDDITIEPLVSRRIVTVNATDQFLSGVLQPLVERYWTQRLADSLVAAMHTQLRNNGLAMARLRCVFDTARGILEVALDSGRLVAVELIGNRSTTDITLRRELAVERSVPIRTAALLESWERLLAMDLFSSVSLSMRYLDPNNDAVALTVQVRERGSQVLRIGGRTDNERNAQPTIEIADLNIASTGVRAALRLGGGGRNSIVSFRADVPRILESYWTANAESYWDSRNIYLYRPRTDLPPNRYERFRDGERIEQRFGIRVSVGSNVETLGKVAISLRYEYQRGFRLGDFSTSRAFVPLLALGWSTTLDDEDRADFPTSGRYVRLSIERTVLDRPSWLQFFKTDAVVRMTNSMIPGHVLRWSVRFGIGSSTLPLPESFNLGGEDLFYGMREEEERGGQLLLGQFEYRFRMPWDIVFPTYLSARYDLGAVWQQVQAIKLDNLKHGVGVSLAFDTPIGPARFSVGRAFYFRGTPSHMTIGPALGYFSIGMRIQ
ncbi:MAG: patatin-like phospholipase family protein [Chlorobi bacterium]|nr:patatin-like phospholipase family protein [Chlorobiota bacterium]